jgi:threonine/homoserine/homoserine lactone efflux protein
MGQKKGIDMESITFIFILSSLILILTPGQDMVLVMSRSLCQGSRAGLATAAGVSTGLLGHTILAALGLGALLQASEFLFTLMKWVGALYLIYLGVRSLLFQNGHLEMRNLQTSSIRRIFVQGAFSNISNPKIAIFYFAYLPQFVRPGAANPTLQLFTLGLCFVILTFLVKAPIGYIAGKLSAWLRSRPFVITWMHRVSGLVLVGMGLQLALERRS